MTFDDQLRFWLEMAWRLPVAYGLRVIETLGLPLVLGIFVAAFCVLGYRCLMERIK